MPFDILSASICSEFIKHTSQGPTLTQMLTSAILVRKASVRCLLKQWLSAADMKSQKNSSHSVNDGEGHAPDSRDGAVNRS